jgi:hypothetical protein
MAARHSIPLRGLSPTGVDTTSPLKFEGRFGRLFTAKAADFGTNEAAWIENLRPLAQAMVSDPDDPKDGPDAEESGIPALYTYLGQFIDHDLTFDPSSSFQKIKDPNALTDYRTPALDLDNVYGRGPGDQPYMYQADGVSFALGDPLLLGDPGAHDLLRSPAGRALIGDPRNDENAIVSQLQGLFHRFHNRLMAQAPPTDAGFAKVRREVTRYYQYVVLSDFLPKIVSGSVLEQLQTRGRFDRTKLKLFQPQSAADIFIPVEFSVAAYRLGHSMVRPGYRLNDATLLPIFPTAPKGQRGFPEGLTGFRRMISDWAIDWGRFINVGTPRKYDADPNSQGPTQDTLSPFKRLQFAYRIDTAIVNPLQALPESVASNTSASLALRNLVRGAQLGLPSGQDVARAMGVDVMADKDILIGQAVDKNPTSTAIEAIGDGRYKDKCPLWTYILAEAARHKRTDEIPVKENEDKPGSVKISTPQLGPVGGRIVAEVLLGLMFADPLSLLSQEPDWVPPSGKGYQLKDFVQFALG